MSARAKGVPRPPRALRRPNSAGGWRRAGATHAPCGRRRRGVRCRVAGGRQHIWDEWLGAGESADSDVRWPRERAGGVREDRARGGCVRVM
jgi:hypothetical protein